MASYHLSQKIGHAGKAAPHAAYIARLGEYAVGKSKGKNLKDLEVMGSGNMPPWARANSVHFWRAADIGEVATGASVRPVLDDQKKAVRTSNGHIVRMLQKNRGQAYTEIEVALPRELNAAQRLALVHEFIDQELGALHAYTFSVHTPKAKIDGGEQPHLHLMYSERMRDEIERDPEQYFRRYRPKNLGKGGCQKATSRKTVAQNKEDLVARRERWALLQNRHLQVAGFDHKVDHRSHAERRISEQPERHLGARALELQREEVRAQRQLKALVRAAKVELRMAEDQLEKELQAQAEWCWLVEEDEMQAHEQARAEEEARVIEQEQEQAQEAAAAAQAEIEHSDETWAAWEQIFADMTCDEPLAEPHNEDQNEDQNDDPDEDQDDPAPVPGM